MLTNKPISIPGFLSECICIHLLPAHRAGCGFSLPAAAAPAVPGFSSRVCRLGWKTPADRRETRASTCEGTRQGAQSGMENLGPPPSPWRTTPESPRHPLVLCLLTHSGGEPDPPRWRVISKSTAGAGGSSSSPRAFPRPNKSRSPAVAPGTAGRGDRGDFMGRPPPAWRGAPGRWALREG